MFNQRIITLVFLSPKQFHEDQVRLQKESDLKKESEKKKTSENHKEKKKWLRKMREKTRRQI